MNDKLITKAEGVNQEIETGMTLNQMWSSQAALMDKLSYEDSINELTNTVDEFLSTQNNPEYVMLNSKELNYMTIFKRTPGNTNTFASLIADFMLTELELKMYSTEGNDHMVQAYAGTNHYALFNAEHLMVTM